MKKAIKCIGIRREKNTVIFCRVLDKQNHLEHYGTNETIFKASG